MKILSEAVFFASIKHKNQRRKDNDSTPYINHPIEVMHVLASCAISDPDILAAGLLHDTIEDTQTSAGELEEKFGKKITSIVLECSDDKSLDKIERKQQQILHASTASNEAKQVKLADKYSNLNGLYTNPPTTWSTETIDGYVNWCWVVCSKLYGVNTKLDELLQNLFSKFGVNNVTEEQLNLYYANIAQTD